jgi:acetylornithine deacetylase/succinyl-diaminopimelate desuccinylase-like protein
MTDDVRPKPGAKKWKILAGGAGFFAILAAWVVFSANDGLAPSKISSKAPAIKIDWGKVEHEAVKHLQGLLAIPSVNPPGNEEPAALYLQAILKEEGIKSQVIRTAPRRALLYARLPGTSSEGALCLTNHIDVVPAVPAAWKDKSLPFSGKIIDGKIYGRGALDMKGFVIMQMMTMILVKRHKVPLEHDLVFMALPDEEAGGQFGAGWVAKNRKDLLRGISCMWNEGGMGIKKMKGINQPIFALKHAERGILWIKLSATGPGGHGSSAPFGNAPQRLYQAIDRIMSVKDPMTLTPSTKRMFAQMARGAPLPNSFFLKRASHPLLRPLLDRTFRKERFLKAISRNTRSLTVWEMGRKVNVIPAKAMAKVDIRLLPGVDPDSFLEDIKALVKDLDITIEVIHKRGASQSPVGSPLFDVIRSTVERLHPNALVVPLLSPGGTDSATFRPLGIDCYGLIPALFTKEEMAGFHGANEHMHTKALIQGTRATFEASVNFSQIK